MNLIMSGKCRLNTNVEDNKVQQLYAICYKQLFGLKADTYLVVAVLQSNILRMKILKFYTSGTVH